MAIKDEQLKDILKVVAGLFNAAPGGNNLTELAGLVDGGMSKSQLADALAANSLFTKGIMAGKVTTDAQAAVLMNNFGLVADDVATSAGSQALKYFKDAIDAKTGFGNIIVNAIDFLSSATLPDEFKSTATLLNNKVKVSEAYSAASSSSDLGVLQNVLSNVKGDKEYTSDDVAAILAGSGSGGGTGKSFVLTVDQDTATATSFDGPIHTAPATGAQIQTLTSVDKLSGSGASDTLNAILNATEASTKPTLTGIENINLTSIANSIFDAANSTGISKISSVDSSNAGDLTVRNLSTAATVNFKGSAAGATAADLSVQFANSLVSGTDDAASITLDNVGQGALTAATYGILNLRAETAGGFEKLNVTTSGGASRLADLGSDTTVNVGAAMTVNNSVKQLNVDGAADLRVDNVLRNTATVDAKTMTGNLRVNLDTNLNVTATGGKGNDYFDFTTGLSNLDKVDGGDGRDTIAVTGAGVNNGLGDGNQVTNIEILRNDGVTGGTSFNLSKISSLDAIVHASANTATYQNLSKAGAADATKGLTIASGGTGASTVTVKDANALGSNTDVLAITVGQGGVTQAATFVAGAVTTSAIESIVVNVSDVGANTATAAGAFLTADASLGSVTYKGGSSGVAFSAGAVAGSGVALTNLDGSAFVGNLTLTGNAFSQVIKGGSGYDVLSTGGHAAFALGTVADTLTGNGGNDTFRFDDLTDGALTGANLTAIDAPAAVTATNRGEIATISDLNLGGATVGLQVDTIGIDGAVLGAVAAGGFAIVNGGSALAMTGANLGVALDTLVTTGVIGGAGLGVPAAGLFTWGSDTYLVASNNATSIADTFGTVAGEDMVIKVTGVVGTLDASDFVA